MRTLIYSATVPHFGEMQARLFLISGHVQGVGFRYFVQEHAQRLRLSGYAQNLADGRVEVLAAGEAKSIDTLRGYLHQGPIGSSVRAVEESDPGSVSGNGFFIR
jgi:acylphosphatase